MNSQAPYRWVYDPRNISKGSSTTTRYQQELSSTTITDPQRRSLRPHNWRLCCPGRRLQTSQIQYDVSRGERGRTGVFDGLTLRKPMIQQTVSTRWITDAVVWNIHRESILA
jgi:hypothetical protein